MRRFIFCILWAAVFLGGGFLLFHAIDRPSLWDDEMSSVHESSLSFPEAVSYYRVTDYQPPLFYVQLRLWRRWAGSSLTVLRANSAVWGTLSLAALYGLAVAVGCPPAAALWMMAFLAFSP